MLHATSPDIVKKITNEPSTCLFCITQMCGMTVDTGKLNMIGLDGTIEHMVYINLSILYMKMSFIWIPRDTQEHHLLRKMP